MNARRSRIEQEIRRIFLSSRTPKDLDVKQAIDDVSSAMGLQLPMRLWLKQRFGIESPYQLDGENQIVEAWEYVGRCAQACELAARHKASKGKVVTSPFDKTK